MRADSVNGDTDLSRPSREAFDDIHLDLSHKPGKCRIAESGLGWKPQGGETFTLDKGDIENAVFSRASRGWELKIYARKAGAVQLDGFKADVSARGERGAARECKRLTGNRTSTRYRNASKCGTAKTVSRRSMR